MFNNHFVAGLLSVHPKFPMYLWYELLPQAFITLNLLQTSRTCLKISVYAHLHGIYNFYTTPLSPPDVRALIYNDTNQRVSYGVHGDEAYHLGPALEHYRCYKCFVPYTGGIIICATAQFFPIDIAAPMLSPTTKILVATNESVNELKEPSPLFTTSASSDHLAALKKLATIFEIAASSRLAPNTKNLPQPASVQLAPIHVPQPPTQQFATYSTPLNPTPEPPANADIPATTTIPYNESELIPPRPPMFNNHRPSTHRYPTRARNGAQHIIDCVLKEQTVNMCTGPEMV